MKNLSEENIRRRRPFHWLEHFRLLRSAALAVFAQAVMRAVAADRCLATSSTRDQNPLQYGGIP
jgi:hypothetical protein